MSKPALINVFAAVVAALVASAPASAASHSCQKAGYSADYRDAHNVVLSKYVPGYWEKDGSSTAVCSRAHGKVVVVGESGTTGDGPVWSSPEAMNENYVAVVDGYGGNADGGEDTHIRVLDLKTGKRVSVSSTVPGDVYDMGVRHAALSPNGDLGWVVSYSDGDSSGGVEIRLLAKGAKASRLVAAGEAVDPDFLRWSADGSKLLWAGSVETATFPRLKYPVERAAKRSRCMRSGDRVVGRDYGFVYFERKFSGSQWKNGVALVGCSTRYKRRVVLARSGVYGSVPHTYEMPTGDDRFVAIVTHKSNVRRVERTSVQVFDLARGERTCSVTAAPECLEDVLVSALTLDLFGTAAWIADARKVDGSGRTKQISSCGRGRLKRLVEGPGIDGEFLRIDGYEGRVSYVTSVKSAP